MIEEQIMAFVFMLSRAMVTIGTFGFAAGCAYFWFRDFVRDISGGRIYGEMGDDDG